jgi:diacylglycerol O-acyltransferase / wax synthase
MGYDRLSAQDVSFLHLESPSTPMHVGSLVLFEGGPFFDDAGHFRIDEARERIASRLHLVPRFRKRLLTVPLQQGRPVWVDDEAFDLSFHVRLTALPKPGSEEQLKALMGRLQGQVLDRRRPLWELWFVEGLEGGRVAIIQKTHHALVDGIAAVDVGTVLLDFEPHPPPAPVPEWVPEAAPNRARLLADSVRQRATQPAEIVRSARAVVRGPRRVVDQARQLGRAALDLRRVAPRLPFNVPVGPHRRFEIVRVDLGQVKAIRQAHGGTVNDVVLAMVTGGLRHYLSSRGELVDDLVVRAMVPVSVRDDTERMLLGNRVSAVVADLPVGEPDPVARLRAVHEQMKDLKERRQAVAADAIMSLADYAPPTLLSLAARLVPFQRTVNLGVTNVPGPQVPLYCMGARMLEAFPFVNVIDNVALIVAILSYDGQLGFGLCGDRDAMADMEVLAEGIEKATVELAS